MRSIWVGVALLATACASAKDGSQTSTSATATTKSSDGATASAASAIAIAPASAGSAEVASARGGVVYPEAATLKRLGGTYLCDQRVYPQGGGGHISAWEWAFASEPAELANQLARELVGSEREGLTFRYKGAEGNADVVVSVESAAKSSLGCKDIPAGSKSLVVASTR